MSDGKSKTKIAASEWPKWEALFRRKIEEAEAGNSDPAHDLAHFGRVVTAAKAMAEEEQARMEVVVPAAWLHDLVNVPKNDPRRSQASRLSAEAAVKFLMEEGYPKEYLDDIAHAVEAHSFSANIEPRTLEAAIVQDADRLDGLGAVGIARCFSVGVQMGARFYEPRDPFARNRELDDRSYSVDHFEVKLFKTADTMRTRAGRQEAAKRVEFMKEFLKQLGHEVGQPARY